MLRKIAIGLGLVVTMLVVAGGGLYLAGARIQVDGGGGVHVAFPKSAEDQAREVARHREAQRAQAASWFLRPPSLPRPSPPRQRYLRSRRLLKSRIRTRIHPTGPTFVVRDATATTQSGPSC